MAERLEGVQTRTHTHCNFIEIKKVEEKSTFMKYIKKQIN